MLLTFQDYQTAVEKGKQITFIRDAIENHRNTDQFKMAEIADEYDAQRNTTINETVRKIYSLTGKAVQDFINSICFYDAKRAINKDMLMRMNLLPALNLLKGHNFGLSPNDLAEASSYIIQHSNAVTSQQSIDFEAVHL